MDDQKTGHDILNDMENDIDRMIRESERFGSAFGNQLRIHLFNAKTTVATLKLDQPPPATAEEVDVRLDAAAGSLNVGGMGGQTGTVTAQTLATSPEVKPETEAEPEPEGPAQEDEDPGLAIYPPNITGTDAPPQPGDKVSASVTEPQRPDNVPTGLWSILTPAQRAQAAG